jgi:hypothetical protein
LNSPAEDGLTPFDLMWRALRARTEAGESLDAFHEVPLPQALLDEPLGYQSATGAVSIYAAGPEVEDLNWARLPSPRLRIAAGLSGPARGWRAGARARSC